MKTTIFKAVGLVDLLEILLGSQSMSGKVEIGGRKIMCNRLLVIFYYISYLMLFFSFLFYLFFIFILGSLSGEILRGR